MRCPIRTSDEVLIEPYVRWPESKEELDLTLKMLRSRYEEAEQKKIKEAAEFVVESIRSKILSTLAAPFPSKENEGVVRVQTPTDNVLYNTFIRDHIEQQKFESFPALEYFVWNVDRSSAPCLNWKIEFKFSLKDGYHSTHKPAQKRSLPQDKQTLKRFRNQTGDFAYLEYRSWTRGKCLSDVISYIENKLLNFIMEKNYLSGNYEFDCYYIPIPPNITVKDTDYLQQIKDAFTSYDYIESMELTKHSDWHAKIRICTIPTTPFALLTDRLSDQRDTTCQTSSSSTPPTHDLREEILACGAAALAALPRVPLQTAPLPIAATTESPLTDCCTPPTVDPPADATA